MVRKGAIAMGVFSIITIVMLLVSSLPPEITSRIDIQTDQNTGNIFDFNGTGTNSVINIDTIFNFNKTNTNSVIDTSVIITESDDTLLERFLDEQGIGFTEKFGIITNIAVLDSDQNIETFSDVLNIPIFSVTDNSGRILDLGAIQVTMQSISAKEEANVNIWGTVEFFLDDTKVDTKKIWASGQNVNTLDLSLVDSLTFDNTNTNSQLDSEIAEFQSKLNIVGTASTAQLRDMANSLNIQFDSTRSEIEDELRKEILFLQSQFNSDVKSANAPSFSQQEKRNHTFTLSDEGRDWVDQSEHTYRVVITEIHAKLESDSEIKEFNWSGQNIAYELKVKVNGSKKVILDSNNKAIEIFKSDNNLQLCTMSFYADGNHHVKTTVPNVVIKDVDGTILIDASHIHNNVQATASYITDCSTFSGIPRSSTLTFVVNGVDYIIDTPDSQANYHLKSTLSGTSGTPITCPFDVNRICGIKHNFITSVSSNFGYP